MRRISKQDLQNLYEPVPERYREDMRSVLSALDERKDRTVMKRKTTLAFVMVAMLIIAGVAAMAVGNLDIFRSMTEVAEPIIPLEGAEELVETPVASAENEYVTVKVREAVYDGQGAAVLLELAPTEPENYALLNAFFQDTPSDVYETRRVPVEVAEGEQEMPADGRWVKIVNRSGAQKVSIDGVETEIPSGREAAMAENIPVYLEAGKLYYADQWEFVVDGRLDGKKCIEYWPEVQVTGADGVSAGSVTMDAEEQTDGSVLIWVDSFADTPMGEMVEVVVRMDISSEGKERATEEISFELEKKAPEQTIRIIPEGGPTDDGIEIVSASINLSKVRGYFVVEYSCAAGDRTEMSIGLCDMEGNRVTTGAGWSSRIGEGMYRECYVVQSFEEIPDKFVLTADTLEGAELGSWECRVEFE